MVHTSRCGSLFLPLSLLGLLGCPREPSEGDDDVGETSTGDEESSGDTESDTSDDRGETGDPECGNGVVDGDEQCDDGNTVDTDYCSNACTLPTCGDGIVQPGEGCDAGADNGPGKACNAMCQPNVCGDGELGPGESCDDGNDVDDDECSNTCALASCGDGMLDLGEQCDDGNGVDDDACLATCVAASCGDGVVFVDEESCDQGALNSDTAECTASCEQAQCGDGLVWAGMEECDLGAANNGPTSACLESCVANVCGDGFEGPEEACDDGNEVDGDGCSSTCVLESCGDGVMQASEECDDGNDVDTDGCTSACKLPACGDGLMQAGEECDEGNANANDAECTLGCTIAECGDGLVHAGVEQCDDGDANANDAACKADCTDNYCGDGQQGPGEGCDDGNSSNGDTCTNACTLASCGDGFVQDGEQCDDGDGVNSDECTNACTLPACGDSIVQAGEECDDGDQDNTDACTNTCDDAECGDGIVQPVIGDECDDGNLIGNDGCSSMCVEQKVVQVDLGQFFSCAVLDTGKARCWGGNGFGQLGYGNTIAIGDDEHPYTAGDAGFGGTVVQITAGTTHTCVLLDTGAVRCAGHGFDGALGYGNTVSIGDNELPSIAGDVFVGGTVTQVTAGERHTCALLDTGAVRCWGYGGNGSLGYGNTNNIGDNEAPASAGNVNVGGTVEQIVAGDLHTCALLDTGAVRCWGAGGSKLGYASPNNIGDNETPASAGDVDVGGTVVQITAGDIHTCALLDTGAVRCWGDASLGQLGYGNTNNIGDNETPAFAGNVIVGGPVVQITAGDFHTCALLDTGAVRCWGNGFSGQLGYGNTNNIGDNEIPASAGDVNIGGLVQQVDAAYRHVCVVLVNGAVRCWGRGATGELGYGNANQIGDNELPFTAGNVQVF